MKEDFKPEVVRDLGESPLCGTAKVSDGITDGTIPGTVPFSTETSLAGKMASTSMWFSPFSTSETIRQGFVSPELKFG